ncbi:hypothetical protein BUALT_Bualt13G0113400 [Buddleja alternifolia]|uniref:4-hydroxy-tetrahydrodipicolinate synthase n=1 Tax=Buddleja alternifolia TaxID=168488 RepID=A0AAV6WNM6_9LAMI|nr:hypothetical protein BUALT_Bualt13G0113400 [Buddleja alternifolia]
MFHISNTTATLNETLMLLLPDLTPPPPPIFASATSTSLRRIVTLGDSIPWKTFKNSIEETLSDAVLLGLRIKVAAIRFILMPVWLFPQGGMSKWRSPRAAIIPNFHLPMRSYEVKNRTNVDDIKSLRLITAIKTPYLPDGRFDLEAYDALVNMQIEDGVEGVIVGGTTGEGQLMSWDEHIMLIGHTVNCFGASIKVIGNTGSNSTREAIHATEQGFAVGMHAALHINPYYGKTSLEGLISHFDSVLPMGPTIIYNVPSRTGQDIPPRVIHSVAKNPNLAGVKECVGNDRVEEYTSNGVVIWSGNDDQAHDSRWVYGATGVISVTSNLVPGLMRELMFGGNNPSLNSKILPLIEWLFVEPNPIGLNTALAQLGVVRPVFRLPYAPLPLAKRVEFVNIVKEIGRENFVGQRDVQVLDDDDFILIDRY